MSGRRGRGSLHVFSFRSLEQLIMNKTVNASVMYLSITVINYVLSIIVYKILFIIII